MRKNMISGFVFTAMFFAVLCGKSYGMEMLNDQQALKEMLPDADKIESVKKILTPEDLKPVKEKLGGVLNYKQSKGEGGKESVEYVFHYGIKDGKKIGVAIIEEQPGKWGPVKYIVALDVGTGKVKNLAVMSYTEKRGRPIARRNFLEQYLNKGSDFTTKEINAVSGATVSSDSTSFAVKKVIVVYEEVELKKKK